MCELLALSLNKDHRVNNTLETFFERSKYNPHGWGLAYYKNNKRIIQKEPKKAIESEFLKRQLSRNLHTNHLLGHVRFATVGQITPYNCHPYYLRDKKSREWTLIHNGTLFNEKKETLVYKDKQNGETDSERILFKLVDLINEAEVVKGSELDKLERFNIVEEFLNRLSEGNKLNIIISDSELIYVHTNCKGQLHYSEITDGIIISTNPLNFADYELDWKTFPFKEVIGIKDGKILFRGNVHENEYIEDPEVNKLLYLKYANL